MGGAESGAGSGKCGAKTKRATVCGRPAGWGTSHFGVGRCKFHGGSTPTHERSAQVEMARRACATLGIPVETDPAQALMDELWEASGNVAFYRHLVQQLPTHPIPAKRVDIEGGRDDGAVEWEPGKPGVYAPTFHVSGISTGEAKPHILVVLYNQERDRLRAVSAEMLRANVEERRVRMAETDAAKILGAQVSALVAIGLGDRLEEFRVAFVNALRGDAQPVALGALGAG